MTEQDRNIIAYCGLNCFEGCWECADLETCSKLREKHLNNLKKLKKVGIDDFIKANPRRPT